MKDKKQLLFGELVYTSWEHRPAILYKSPIGLKAYSITEPGGAWVLVDAQDVFNSAVVVPGFKALQNMFGKRYGHLELPVELKGVGPGFDLEAADERVERYIQSPEGKDRMERLLAVLKQNRKKT